jgi:hypothetical protein
VGQPAKSPRETFVDALVAALRSGDVALARIAHEALGKVLAEPDPNAPAVADLASERAKRGGRS